MPKFVVQVRIKDQNGGVDWLPVHPSHHPNEPYMFETEEAAEKMMRMCYPDEVAFGTGKVRVHKLEGT